MGSSSSERNQTSKFCIYSIGPAYWIWKPLRTLTVLLPSSRISQKGPNKKWSGWTILRAYFCQFFAQKEPKRGRTLKKCFAPLILSNSREVQEIFSFSQRNKQCRNGKLLGRLNFFPSGGRIFLLDWPKSFEKSWQHCFRRRQMNI